MYGMLTVCFQLWVTYMHVREHMKVSHLGCGGRWSLPGEWHRHRCLHLPLWNYTYQLPESARTQNHCSADIIYSTQTHTHTHTHAHYVTAGIPLVFNSCFHFEINDLSWHLPKWRRVGLHPGVMNNLMTRGSTYMQLSNGHLNKDVLRENWIKRKLAIMQRAKAWWAGLKSEDVCHQLEVTLADEMTSWFVGKNLIPQVYVVTFTPSSLLAYPAPLALDLIKVGMKSM